MDETPELLIEGEILSDEKSLSKNVVVNKEWRRQYTGERLLSGTKAKSNNPSRETLDRHLVKLAKWKF